jgi:hypothetical protein
MAKLNIDLSKLTGLLKGPGLLKGLKGLRTFSVLIWPGVILLACGGVLTAALLMGSGLRQKADKESVPMGNQIKGMLKTSPAAGQADVEKRYQEEFEKDANLIKQLSEQSSERELLSYDIFPKPKDTSTLLFTRFGTKYREEIEGLIKKVNGGDCPTTEEIESAQKMGGGNTRFSQPGGASSRIVEEICQARAKSVSVYVNPLNVGGYDFWKAYQYANIDDSVKDCWFWQVGYWIIEDVFSTTEVMNAGSVNVFSSPVKRVERVGFATPDALYSSTTGASKGLQDKPKYVVKPEDQLTESFTGRLSNEDIDVVHFSLVVVLNSKAIIPFMRELCSAKEHKFTGYTGQEPARVFKHNQITILESRVKPVDLKSIDHMNYRYGADAVVEVEMVCEYIFNKQGYGAIKPESIKGTAVKTGG